MGHTTCFEASGGAWVHVTQEQLNILSRLARSRSPRRSPSHGSRERFRPEGSPWTGRGDLSSFGVSPNATLDFHAMSHNCLQSFDSTVGNSDRWLLIPCYPYSMPTMMHLQLAGDSVGIFGPMWERALRISWSLMTYRCIWAFLGQRPSWRKSAPMTCARSWCGMSSKCERHTPNHVGTSCASLNVNLEKVEVTTGCLSWSSVNPTVFGMVIAL